MTFIKIASPDIADIALATKVPELDNTRRKSDLADWKKQSV
jgi:hypothetical protein